MPLRFHRMPALLTLLVAVLAAGCRDRTPIDSVPPSANSGDPDMNLSAPESDLRLTSPELPDGGTMPTRYTADGEDVSPPLAWEGAPPGTRTFVLICDDPDAPSPRKPAPDPWVHWVLFDVPAETSALPAGVPRTAELTDLGARQGTNSWPSDNLGYRGPAPPPGSGAHRYVFRLYAVDEKLNLSQPNQAELLAALGGHVLGAASLTVSYERK